MTPLLIRQKIGARNVRLNRIPMPANDMANATSIFILGVTGQNRLNIGSVELGPSNDAVGKAVFVGDRL